MTVIDLKFLLKALFLPPGGLVLLGLLALLAWRRRPRLAFVSCLGATLGLWLLATPLVADAMFAALERYPAFDPRHLTPAQARAQVIVILAGGVRRQAPEFGGDAPSTTAVMRLIEGAKVARATHLPVLLSGSPAEIPPMRRFLEEYLDVPVKYTESASLDTHENALFSARVLAGAHLSRVILVTSSAHMGRAAAEFAAAGLEVSAAPAEMRTPPSGAMRSYLPSAEALLSSYFSLYEWGGDLVARLR